MPWLESGLDLMWCLFSDYSNQGVDQLQKVIEMIKTNPDDRRIIMCAWNPKGTEHWLAVNAAALDLIVC